MSISRSNLFSSNPASKQYCRLNSVQDLINELTLAYNDLGIQSDSYVAHNPKIIIITKPDHAQASHYLWIQNTEDLKTLARKLGNDLNLLSDFRKKLTKHIGKIVKGCSSEMKFMQIIGDSYAFSPSGHERALQYISKPLEDPALICFTGLTSFIDPKTQLQQGANGVLSDWIDQNTNGASRIVGQILFPKTPEMVKDGAGCTMNEQVNRFIVVGSEKYPAEFGEDNIISDALSDTALVLEGGVQTFEQMINMLRLHNKPTIYCLAGLREPDRQFHFSAAALVGKLVTIKVNGNMVQSAEECINTYLDSCQDLNDFKHTNKIEHVKTISQSLTPAILTRLISSVKMHGIGDEPLAKLFRDIPRNLLGAML